MDHPPRLIGLPDAGGRWPRGAARASMARLLPVAILLHAGLLALLILAGHRAMRSPAPAPAIEMQLTAAAPSLPALSAPDIPVAQPVAVPLPDAPPPLPLPDPLQARDEAPPPSTPAQAVIQPPTRTAARPTAGPPLPPPSKPAETAPTDAAAGASAAAPSPSPDWNNQLVAWLANHRVYPTQARRHGDQGEVLVRISVDAEGHVLDQVIAQSSGATVLDRAALDLFRDVTLPAPGAAASRVVRLTYRLYD